jgi:hypothetical protein
VARHKTTVRREIEHWVDEQIRAQGVQGIYWVDREDWPQCPLVNPMCPDDLCILPAGHVGTEEGYHVLGTTAYTAAEKFPLEWMMPVGTSVQVLCQEGWRQQEAKFPRDRV